MAILDTNQLIYRYFEEISQIPHGSYHEEKLADYIEDFCRLINWDDVERRYQEAMAS